MAQSTVSFANIKTHVKMTQTKAILCRIVWEFVWLVLSKLDILHFFLTSRYYWGQQYYRPSGGMSNMCRMPIESGDQQFGNIYFQVDQNSTHPNCHSNLVLSRYFLLCIKTHFASLALSKISKALFIFD